MCLNLGKDAKIYFDLLFAFPYFILILLPKENYLSIQIVNKKVNTIIIYSKIRNGDSLNKNVVSFV